MKEDQSHGSDLVLTRVFDAPAEKVFEVWTDPDHFGKWWGPKGFSLTIAKMEVQPGGIFLGTQSSPEGQAMWGKFVYQEVIPPRRLVFIQSFSDAGGNIVRAPFDPNWPLQILNIVTFSEADGRTLLTIEARLVDATEEESTAFKGMLPMVQQGFGGTFDKLADYLESEK